MYKPARPRPKKTNIVRSRTGCDSCRRRRQKCDEKRPRCGTCERLGKCCEPAQGAALKFREVSFSRQRRRDDSQSIETRRDDLQSIASQTACAQASEDHVISVESTSPKFSRGALPSTPAVESLTSHHPDDSYSSLILSWASGPLQQLDYEALDTVVPAPSSLARRQQKTPRGQSGRTSILESDAPGAPCQRPVHNDTNTDLAGALQFRGCLDQEMLYMNIWDTQCLEALHPAFRRFSIVDRPCYAMLDATMALSASYLSRRLPQKKPWSLSDIPGLSYRPGTSHRNSSQHYYLRALRLVSTWTGDSPRVDVNSILAALILFCSIESSMGNFSAFELHSKGIASLVQPSAEQHTPVVTDMHLLSAWLQARLLNWWRRFHFSPPVFQSRRLPITVQPELQDALHDPENRRVAVLLNLCESLSLASLSIIRAWTTAQAAQTTTTTDAEVPTSQDDDAAISHFCSELKACRLYLAAEARKLDEWHARLPISDMPIESFPDFRSGLTQENVILPPRPLLFSSHQAAMNYAYYASARAIQSHATVATAADDDDGYVRSDFWISLVTRIAAGIDWEKCVHYNVYTIGITALLFTCALRTRDLRVGLWIEDWLEERQRAGLEEGSFPVMQLLRILRIMNIERKNGYEIVAVFQTEDDGGGLGKFDSYHSQVITSVMFYGRCRTTGHLFSKIVSV